MRRLGLFIHAIFPSYGINNKHMMSEHIIRCVVVTHVTYASRMSNIYIYALAYCTGNWYHDGSSSISLSKSIFGYATWYCHLNSDSFDTATQSTLSNLLLVLRIPSIILYHVACRRSLCAMSKYF
jgi:hypothetical protein